MLQGPGLGYPVYMLLSVSPKYHSVLLYVRSFSRQIAEFLVSPYSTMVNLKFQTKSLKSGKSKFRNSKQFCEDHWEENSFSRSWKTFGCDLHEEWRLENFVPMGSHVNKTKKKKKKDGKCVCVFILLELRNTSERMSQGKQHNSQNLTEILASGTKITATRTDDRRISIS